MGLSLHSSPSLSGAAHSRPPRHRGRPLTSLPRQTKRRLRPVTAGVLLLSSGCPNVYTSTLPPPGARSASTTTHEADT